VLKCSQALKPHLPREERARQLSLESFALAPNKYMPSINSQSVDNQLAVVRYTLQIATLLELHLPVQV